MKNKFILFFSVLLFFTVDAAAQKKVNYNSAEYDDEFAAYDEEFSKKSTDVIVSDPFESVNRKIFVFNDTLDYYLFEPIARAYHNYVPDPVRNSLKNVVTNLTLPMSSLNSFAQGKLDNGLATFSNFLINSTIGLGGIFDVAGEKNIRYNHEDLGQTLAHYGAKSGPYLVIPILGPSTVRDFGGLASSSAIDPMSFNLLKIGGSSDTIPVEYRYANSIIYYVGVRESLLTSIEDVRRDSFDLYASFRSIYIQKRNAEINR